MATKRQQPNFILFPRELIVYRDSTEPVELSIFNCYEFFVQCAILIWTTNSFEVKKSKMIIGPRSHAKIMLTYTGSREGCSVEKQMFQIVIRDVNTKDVIGIKRIIASIFPAKDQPKEESLVSEDSEEKESKCPVVQVNLEPQKEKEYSGLDSTITQQEIEEHDTDERHETEEYSKTQQEIEDCAPYETEETAEYSAQHKQEEDGHKSLGKVNNEEENTETTWSSIKWYVETIMLMLVLLFLLLLKLKEEFSDTMVFETIYNVYSHNVFVE